MTIKAIFIIKYIVIHSIYRRQDELLDSGTAVAVRKPEYSFGLMPANCKIMGKSFNFPFPICKIIGAQVDLKLVCILLMLSPAFGLAPFLAVNFFFVGCDYSELLWWRKQQEVAERAWVLESDRCVFEFQLCPSWLPDLGQFSETCQVLVHSTVKWW